MSIGAIILCLTIAGSVGAAAWILGRKMDRISALWNSDTDNAPSEGFVSAVAAKREDHLRSL